MATPTSKVRAMVGFLGAAANSFDVLSGAVDIIVLRCSDGTLRSSPFICRFGRFKCIRSYEKIVRIEINGELNPDVYMKIGSAGEAYFIVVAKGPVPAELVASPLGSPGWTSPRSPCNSAGSSPLAHSPFSSPGLPPAGTPPSVPPMSLSAPGPLDLGKPPATMPKQTSEAEASSSSSSSPPPGRDGPGPPDPAPPSGPDEKEADEPLPPLPGGKEQFDMDLLFKKLSGVADTLAGAPRLSGSDGCSPEATSKAATMASDHLSLPRSADLSRSSSPVPPLSPAAVPPPLLPPLPPLRRKTPPEEELQDDVDLQFDDLLVDDGYRGLNDADLLATDPDGPAEYPTEMTLQKTTFPSSAQLEQLKLKDGVNTIRFLVKTTLRGLQQISARIYLWPEGTKVVVSDVDGTVTRSDVWGQILPPLGYDWTHDGICQLYTSIADNGYKMLYLSSRSVSQAAQTRSLLTNVKQGGCRLPDGPLIVSPDRIFGALAREVILRKPEEFKIAALRTVRDVFPNRDPFYAGFGNRDTDFISYREVGIPAHKIFTINSSGLLSVYNCKYESYTSLHELVHHVFPPKANDVSVTDSEFDSFNFWSLPIYEVAGTEHLVSKSGPLSNSSKAPDALNIEALPYEWQWVNSEESRWSAYSRDLQRKIEAAFQAGKPEASIQTPKGWYTVVFKSVAPNSEGATHFQKSDRSKKQRSVRRVVDLAEFVGRTEQPSGWNFWRRTPSIAIAKLKAKAAPAPTPLLLVAPAPVADTPEAKVEEAVEALPASPEVAAPRPPQRFKAAFSSALLDDWGAAELQAALEQQLRSQFGIEAGLSVEVFTQHAWVEVPAEAAGRVADSTAVRLRGQRVVLHRRQGETVKAPTAPMPRLSADSPPPQRRPGSPLPPPASSPPAPAPATPAADNAVAEPTSPADPADRPSDDTGESATPPLRPKALSFTGLPAPSSPGPGSAPAAVARSPGSPPLAAPLALRPGTGSGWFGWLKGNALGGKSPPTHFSTPLAAAVPEALQLDGPASPLVSLDSTQAAAAAVAASEPSQTLPSPSPYDEEAADAQVTLVAMDAELSV